MVRPERLFALRAHPYGVALQAINLAAGQVVELGLFVCREFDHDVEPAATTKGSQARKAMVRPERLFALRAHPFGVALRAINLAENGQVVELPCCLPGVRIVASNHRPRERVLRQENLWCARRDSNSRPPGS